MCSTRAHACRRRRPNQSNPRRASPVACIRLGSPLAQVAECVNCRIVIGPCTGDVFLMDCEGCTFSVAASQIRLRNVTDSELRVHMPNREGFIIEASHGIRVGPWDVGFDGDARAFGAAGMALGADNFWDVVYDFTKDVSYGRPHWTYVPPDQRAPRTRLLLRPSGYCGGSVEALAADAAAVEEAEEVEEVEEEYVDDYEDDDFDEEPAPSDLTLSASPAPQSNRAAAASMLF